MDRILDMLNNKNPDNPVNPVKINEVSHESDYRVGLETYPHSFFCFFKPVFS